MRKHQSTTASPADDAIFWLFIIGLLVVIMVVFKLAGCTNANTVRDTNEWGSEYGNENVRKAVRDEMINNGTDPIIAEDYTKFKYNEEKNRK